jgi:hypothetical protein
MSQEVTAIIHLVKKGRTANSRYGKFLRPDKAPHPDAMDLHLWEGRELSIQEFNELMPVAIRSVVATDTVFGKIIVREGEAAEGDAALLETLKKEHEQTLLNLKAEHQTNLEQVQAGVNEFVATHNANLELAKTRIDELEAQILASEATKPEVVASEPATDTISEESHETSVVEAAPSAAGEQPTVAAATGETAPPEVVTEAAPEAPEAPAPAAKTQAKKKK